MLVSVVALTRRSSRLYDKGKILILYNFSS